MYLCVVVNLAHIEDGYATARAGTSQMACNPSVLAKKALQDMKHAS
jgi:hypothetical protein